MAFTKVASVAQWVGSTASVNVSIINPSLVGTKSGKDMGLDNFPDPKLGLGRINFRILVRKYKLTVPVRNDNFLEA
ncbi:hypothetical protein [Desulfosporosinus lacus]|uniref:hypothetical protein n=1 Tax=Desulfosporosinus lacus TaxID=329936 RepID=UPI001A9A61C4|nr:hypothetical protein [Desulfosporosinus lacus]